MSALRTRLPVRSRDEGGQALVEFSLAILVFLVMVVAIFDLGRGIYVYNGLSEAAREIARATIVHPGSTLGTSQRTADVIGTQRALVPGLGNPTFACVEYDGTAVTGSCLSGHYARVTVTAQFTPVTLFGLAGNFTFTSSSSMQLP